MLKYIVTFTISAAIGLMVLSLAKSVAGPESTALPEFLSFLLPAVFGLVSCLSLFLALNKEMLVTRRNTIVEHAAHGLSVVISIAIASFCIFFLDDYVPEPIPEGPRRLINAGAVGLIVMTCVLILIRVHIKRLAKSEPNGDLDA